MTQTQIQEKLDRIEEILSNQGEQPFSIDEAAAYLHISKSYLYKLTHKRKIAFFKPNGKLVFFKKHDLDAWLFRGRQDSFDEIEVRAEEYLNKKQK